MVNLQELKKEIEYKFGRDKFEELMHWDHNKFYRMLSGRQEWLLIEAKQVQNVLQLNDKKFKSIFFAENVACEETNE